MGNPVLQVVTTGGLFSFDPAGPTLYKLDLQFPNHPSQGLTACSWRGEQFIAAGMGVYSFTGSNIGSMGLDRDEGLPFALGYNAKIVSLVPELNDMYCLVQGDNTDSFASVQRWSGFGWHSVWERGASATVTRLYVSGARGLHRIWWGGGNNSYTIDLPIAFTNPRQIAVDEQDSAFEVNGYLMTGLTNMGMPGSRKIAHSVGIRVASIGSAGIANEAPIVQYRLTNDASFVSLSGPKDAAGDGIVFPASGPVPDDTYFYWFGSSFVGVAFDEIELKITTAQGMLTKWVALYFGKAISGNYAWTVTLDLTEKFENQTPAAMAAKLDTLVTSGLVYTFIYRSTAYKVRVTSWSGADSSGRADTRGMRSVQLLEVHDRP
jgi:hypothetical protein